MQVTLSSNNSLMILIQRRVATTTENLADCDLLYSSAQRNRKLRLRKRNLET